MGSIQQWVNRCTAAAKSLIKEQSTGRQAEDLACKYLRKQGLQLVTKNYHSKAGEIDLIMKENSRLVFVEVKYRTHQDWANAAEAVTLAKQRKIINAAKFYMQQQHIFDLAECRFDVVAINHKLSEANINWIPHAFS